MTKIDCDFEQETVPVGKSWLVGPMASICGRLHTMALVMSDDTVLMLEGSTSDDFFCYDTLQRRIEILGVPFWCREYLD